MGTVDDLARLDYAELARNVSEKLGRNLGPLEGLELACLAGAYRVGRQSVLYCDPLRGTWKVGLPDFLRRLGYPLTDEDGGDARGRT